MRWVNPAKVATIVSSEMSFDRSKRSRLRRFVADKSRLGIAGNEMLANRRVCKRGADARKRASSAFSGSNVQASSLNKAKPED